MGRHARIRAAEQMERDGIRRLAPNEVSTKKTCRHVIGESFGFRSWCPNKQRYHVEGVGNLCFTHAITFAGRMAKGQRAFQRSGLARELVA
jgi:hypothetical protein